MLLAALLAALLVSPTVPAAAAAMVGADQAPPAGTWVAQASGTTDTLHAVSFADATHGYAVGAGGKIVATVDGGRHWSSQVACTGPGSCGATSRNRITADLLGVMFTDAATGHAVGASGTIVATVDGGRHWVAQFACTGKEPCNASSPDRVSSNLTGVAFIDDAFGYTVGDLGTILVTRDGGKHWDGEQMCSELLGDECMAPIRPELTGVAFPAPSEAHAVGSIKAGNTLARVTPTGQWTNASAPGPLMLANDPVNLDAVSFTLAAGDSGGASASFGHAVGQDGVILASEDAGNSWGPQSSGTTAELTSVSFPDAANGHAVGLGGAIVATTDGGRHWVPETSGTGSALRGVSFPEADRGYAVGDGGTIVAQHLVPVGLRVAKVTPTTGSTAGGTAVTLTGAGLLGATAVYFGGVPAQGFNVASDQQVTAVSPRHSFGVGAVTVSGPAGTSEVTAAARFTFNIPNEGTWKAAAPCPPPCDGPGVVLADGRVLVAGGSTFTPATATSPASGGQSAAALLYDPATDAWRQTGPMVRARAGHSLTTFADGSVLAAGGTVGTGAKASASDSAERYDPVSGRWHPVAAMHFPRSFGRAVRLGDGTALVVGGSLSSGATAESYDPVRDTWSLTGPMAAAEYGGSATLLASGQVLVAGGTDEYDSVRSQLYDPLTRTWRLTGPLHLPRSSQAATLLGNGEVLVVGGAGFGPYPFDELYDPASGTWRAAPPLNVVRSDATLVRLTDGHVLAIGGEGGRAENTTSVEQYDPGSAHWSLISPLPLAGSLHQAMVLGPRHCGARCGTVLVYGGGHSAAFVFTPATPLPDARSPSGGPSLVFLGLVAGLIGASAGVGMASVVGARRRRRQRRSPAVAWPRPGVRPAPAPTGRRARRNGDDRPASGAIAKEVAGGSDHD